MLKLSLVQEVTHQVFILEWLIAAYVYELSHEAQVEQDGH